MKTGARFAIDLATLQRIVGVPASTVTSQVTGTGTAPANIKVEADRHQTIETEEKANQEKTPQQIISLT